MKPSRWPDIFRLRFRSLFSRNSVERELEKELKFHLEQEAAERQATGLPVDEAGSAAHRRLGGVEQIKEECRDMRKTGQLESTLQDLRYAARVLVKNPGFTTVVILTLALSIGATSAIVSVIEGVLVRPLPFQNPTRLVRLFTHCSAFAKFPINPNDFLDLRATLRSVESMAAYTHRDLQLSDKNDAVRLAGMSVTAGYFHVLGLEPAIGREFGRSDESRGKDRIAIVSDRVWRTRLGARRDVLGQKIILNATPFTVVGVMPPGVQHPGNTYHAVAYGDTIDVWVPFVYEDRADRGSHFLDAIARLNPGFTPEQARSEMNVAMQQLGKVHRAEIGWDVLVVPLKTEIVGGSRPVLFVLLAAVALVLLLACVNTANLLLARGTSRQREIAVRAAVGAGRTRIVRQLLTESLLLAGIGGVLGAVLMLVGVRVLVALLPADFPRSGDIRVDALVFLFTLVLTFGSGIVFGMIPALQGSRLDLRTSLYESGRSNTSSRRTLRLRNGLVVSEVTLACVLLIGAALMLRSFMNLVHADAGFRPDRVLTASLSLPEANYKDRQAVTLFGQRLLARFHETPGVSLAGIGSDLPWTGWDDNAGGLHIRGEVPLPQEDFGGRYHMASPGFFRTLGIPVARGREFDDRDTANAPQALIINQAFARFWRHGDALGGKVTFKDNPKTEDDWMTVVGIVRDIKDTPKDAGAKPAFWWPMYQVPFSFGDFSVAIRTNLDAFTAIGLLRKSVQEVDPGLAVADIRSMEQIANGSYSTTRFAFVLVGLFATLALLLAAIGTYGVIAYSVSQRVHEFGVRMALGAKPLDLAGGVFATGMKLALAGTVLGTLLGIAFTRLLGSLLYGVGTTDPFAIGSTVAIALVAAALACCVPAIRATRADPMTALRAD